MSNILIFNMISFSVASSHLCNTGVVVSGRGEQLLTLIQHQIRQSSRLAVDVLISVC